MAGYTITQKYILIVYLISWLIDLVCWWHRSSPIIVNLGLALVMFVPGIIGGLFQKNIKKNL